MQSLCQTHQIALIQEALIDPGRHNTLGPLSKLHQKSQKQALQAPERDRPTQTCHTEEILELRMEVGKYRRRAARCPLPATERPRLNTVMVNGARFWLVADTKPIGSSPIGELDVLPRRSREILSETIESLKLTSRQRDVRGVDEIEWHGARIFDDEITELSPILVDET